MKVINGTTKWVRFPSGSFVFVWLIVSLRGNVPTNQGAIWKRQSDTLLIVWLYQMAVSRALDTTQAECSNLNIRMATPARFRNVAYGRIVLVTQCEHLLPEYDFYFLSWMSAIARHLFLKRTQIFHSLLKIGEDSCILLVTWFNS